MLDILPKQGKATMESIPSKKDRSMFSCVRYKFFLEAPFEISQKCCGVMKKNIVHTYARKSGRKGITAQTASESRLRTQQWIKNGCNAFNAKHPISNPMSFWTEQDVLLYIYLNNLPIASVYGEVVKDGGSENVDGQMSIADFGLFDDEVPTLKTTGCKRTGCFACGYGMHMEKPCESRIQNIIDFSNPKLADWMLRGGAFCEDGLWKPSKGLGYWFVILWINKYGNMHIYFPNPDYYIKKYSTGETDRYLFPEGREDNLHQYDFIVRE